MASLSRLGGNAHVAKRILKLMSTHLPGRVVLRLGAAKWQAQATGGELAAATGSKASLQWAASRLWAAGQHAALHMLIHAAYLLSTPPASPCGPPKPLDHSDPSEKAGKFIVVLLACSCLYTPVLSPTNFQSLLTSAHVIACSVSVCQLPTCSAFEVTAAQAAAHAHEQLAEAQHAQTVYCSCIAQAQHTTDC